jgi:hypothetical protein
MITMVKQGLLTIAATLIAVSAHADHNFGLGVKAGTLGIGVEGTWRPPVPWLDLRVGANSYDHSDNGSYSGIPYDGTLSLNSYYAAANLHFPLTPLRVTAGIYDNGNELSLTSSPSDIYDIGGIPFDAADVGTLSSLTQFRGAAPYFGFGFDFTMLNRVGLNLDLGVLWQGDPSVTLAADGPVAVDPLFRLALERERRDIVNELKDYKAWPVASLGIVFNFL